MRWARSVRITSWSTVRRSFAFDQKARSPMSASIEETTASGLSLLRELLAIRSPSGQEMPAVNHLVKWLGGHGFMAHRDGAGNAVGVLEAPRRPGTPARDHSPRTHRHGARLPQGRRARRQAVRPRRGRRQGTARRLRHGSRHRRAHSRAGASSSPARWKKKARPPRARATWPRAAGPTCASSANRRAGSGWRSATRAGCSPTSSSSA